MSLDVSLTLNNTEIWSANITHNLNKLAKELRIYKEVWRPDENEIYFAEQMIEPLEKGIASLDCDPVYYEQFNSSNGWGTWRNMLSFLKEYLAECKRNPLASIEAHR